MSGYQMYMKMSLVTSADA